ncbi:DUF2336 domain-containing protein [bacterium]|nr:DUF2336 domain-containing protein [bacterium]
MLPSKPPKQQEVLPPRTVIALKGQEIYVQRGETAPVPLLEGARFSVEISDEARCHIAFKIARLLPDLQDHQKADLLAYTVRVLTLLCRDQLLRVREILSEELKEMPFAPRDVVMSLAKDEADSVAVPILECSPVLTDQDLVEIIKSTGRLEVLTAVAARKRLSSLVTDALIACRNVPVMQRLLGNKGASYSEPGMELMAVEAEKVEPMHEPLLRLPDLPQRILNRMATFVSKSLIERMTREGALPASVSSSLLEQISKRLQTPSLDKKRKESSKARELSSSGELTPEGVEDALERGELAFVKTALTHLSGLPEGMVDRIIKSENGKAITALCWKAGVSMRVALQVQMRMGRLHHTKVVHAKNGREYPLTPEEMQSYLDFFVK